MIVLLFLSTALLNLLVGVGMALVWEWLSPPVPAVPVRSAPKPSPASAKRAEPETRPLAEKEPDVAPSAAERPVEECVPAEWLGMLSENAVAARSFVEATAQVLRLKIMAYREQLIRIEDQIRRLPSDGDPSLRDGLMVELINLNGEWLQTQSDAMGALIDRREVSGALANVAAQLEDALLEQTAMIETARLRLEMAQESASIDIRTIVSEVQGMLACANRLRDLMQTALAAILDAEERYEECEESWQIDPLCQIMNRAGIELLVHQWRSSEHAKEADNSLMLLDIEQFEQINERFGAQLADQLLAELSALLTGGLRKQRGFDRLGRFSGQQFLALLGSTSAELAAGVAERLRQTVERATIRCAGTNIPLRIRAAVVDLSLQAPLAATLARLQEALAAAKSHETSCTFLDSGSGPRWVKPTVFRGTPPVIEFESALMVPELELEPVA